jgi:hypothetical protein
MNFSVTKYAGDFGHCTDYGNTLIAENVAKTLTDLTNNGKKNLNKIILAFIGLCLALILRNCRCRRPDWPVRLPKIQNNKILKNKSPLNRGLHRRIHDGRSVSGTTAGNIE